MSSFWKKKKFQDNIMNTTITTTNATQGTTKGIIELDNNVSLFYFSHYLSNIRENKTQQHYTTTKTLLHVYTQDQATPKTMAPKANIQKSIHQ